MTIKISRNVENRITVSFPYNPDYIAKIKTIQGYRWHPEEKYWSLPLDNDILDRLASLFEDERLEIDPFLQTLREKAKPMRDFEDLRRDLVSRKYSPKTIKTYKHLVNNTYHENFTQFVNVTDSFFNNLGDYHQELSSLFTQKFQIIHAE